MRARLVGLVGRTMLAVLCVTLPPSLSAQAPRRPVSVGIGGGGTVPVGAFGDDVKTGWHGHGFLQYQPAIGPWAVRGEVQYHRAQYTDDFLDFVGAVDGDDLNNGVLLVGVAGVFAGSGRSSGVSPYLIGGLGLYRETASLSDGTTTLSQSETGFGFSGGAGLRFGRSVGFFVESRFHQFSIRPDGQEKTTTRFVPVTLGIVF